MGRIETTYMIEKSLASAVQVSPAERGEQEHELAIYICPAITILLLLVLG